VEFSHPLPWWLAVIVAAAIAGAALLAYRRPLVPLSSRQRAALISLRVLALALVVVFLVRPVVTESVSSGTEMIVPVLVDVSRSMRVPDVGSEARIASARRLFETSILPSIGPGFRAELYSVGTGMSPVAPADLHADAAATDLVGALKTASQAQRRRRVPGIVLLSDGADTGQTALESLPAGGPPVFTVGMGSESGLPDREIAGMTAGDQRLDQAAVDLRVTAVSYGFRNRPFQLRLLANGRVVEAREIVPRGDGPVEEAFTVTPDPQAPTVYSAEIAAEEGEAVAENNARSLLVNPIGRKRRMLVLSGAPGYEHSFLARALTIDPGLDVDTVVRKGRNDAGQPTYLVQAGGGRADVLTTGFPSTRQALYAYDAVVIVNVEGDVFTRDQLGQLADFVSARGGGLLVLGGRSFSGRGLIGTPLEDAVPLALGDRRGAAVRGTVERPGALNTVTLTEDGEHHPAMRIAPAADESRRLWSALPALASAAPLGGPRPGAIVLAVTAASDGGVRPLVAVQRYGRGRSMVFAGEGAWRWRMMLPAADRSYEFIWRQAARWLSSPAPDPVSIQAPASAEPGDAVEMAIEVRDELFQPVATAEVEVTFTAPGAESRRLPVARAGGTDAHFTSAVRLEMPGLHRVNVSARRGNAALGSTEAWFYVGGASRELAEPRLNRPFLERLSARSGGRYLEPAEVDRLRSWLQAVEPLEPEAGRRDLWNRPWTIALVIALLSTEWTLRRRWGLR
jgi:uncharacterized membrane protein